MNTRDILTRYGKLIRSEGNRFSRRETWTVGKSLFLLYICDNEQTLQAPFETEAKGISAIIAAAYNEPNGEADGNKCLASCDRQSIQWDYTSI